MKKKLILFFLVPFICFGLQAQQADQQLIKAGFLLQFKLYQEALNAVDLSPSTQDLNYYELKGKIYMGLSDYPKALENFMKNETLRPGNSIYDIARCQSLLGNQAVSLEYLKKYLKSPEKLPVNRIMNDSAFMKMRNTAAWNKLWQDVSYSDLEITVNKIRTAANADDGNNLNSILTESLRTYPANPELLYQQAKYYEKLNLPDLAYQSINQAVLHQSGNDIYQFEKSRLAFKNNAPMEALAAINNAISLNPFIPEYYFTRIQVFQSLNNKTKAEEDIKLLENCMPDLTQVKIIKVQMDMENGKNLEALTTLNEMIKADQSKPLYYLLRGKVELLGGQYQNADKDLGMSLDLDPNNQETNLEKGNVLFKMQDKDSACFYWQNAANKGNRQAKENYIKYCDK